MIGIWWGEEAVLWDWALNPWMWCYLQVYSVRIVLNGRTPVGVQELLGSAWEIPIVHWCQNLKRKDDLYVSRDEEVSKPTHVQRSSKWTPKTLKLVFKIDQKFNWAEKQDYFILGGRRGTTGSHYKYKSNKIFMLWNDFQKVPSPSLWWWLRSHLLLPFTLLLFYKNWKIAFEIIFQVKCYFLLVRLLMTKPSPLIHLLLQCSELLKSIFCLTSSATFEMHWAGI